MIIYVRDLLAKTLNNSFNVCSSHGYVPNNFVSQFLSLLVQIKIVNNYDAYDNYTRPISLVTMFSKIFELCLTSD